MSEPGGKTVGSPGPDHRWLVLVTVAIAQPMVVLDATIVDIALPSAQRDLGFANSDRQWVVTAYALAFGGLLLLGGRVGDLFSRKRVFMVGVGFAGASAFGGAATSFGLLVTARATARSLPAWRSCRWSAARAAVTARPSGNPRREPAWPQPSP